jgi:hypothetical protein
MRKCFLFIFLFVALVAVTAQNAQSQPLLSESWATNTFNLAKWKVGQGTNSQTSLYPTTFSTVTIVDGGGGDLCLREEQPAAGNWVWGQNQILSVSSFKRGAVASHTDNVRCTFTVWHTAVSSGSRTTDIMGPWFNYPTTAMYGNHEAAIITDYPAVYGGIPFKLNQKPNVAWGSAALNRTLGINAAWTSATSKATALRIRVSLDVTTGAQVEYSLDGGATYTTDVNTKGVSGDTQATGLYIGFGQVQSSGAVGSTYFDDILVENNESQVPVELSSMEID